MGDVYDKESGLTDKKPQPINIPKIDLHGISLKDANKIVTMHERRVSALIAKIGEFHGQET